MLAYLHGAYSEKGRLKDIDFYLEKMRRYYSCNMVCV